MGMTQFRTIQFELTINIMSKTSDPIARDPSTTDLKKINKS